MSDENDQVLPHLLTSHDRKRLFESRLLTDRDEERLFENGRRHNRRLADGQVPEDDMPVVLLFAPDAESIWLLSRCDPLDTDSVFGLCDLGIGLPEPGFVRLSEISRLNGRLGLPVLRHPFFVAYRPLGWYVKRAREEGRIIL